MSEIVQKEVELKIFKSPLTNSKMKAHTHNLDIKIKELKEDSFYLGEIYVDQQIYGVLGIEKEYWTDKSFPNQNYLERITINLYNKKGSTIGIIEERLLKELLQSVVSGKMPVFTVLLSGIPYIIDIDKETDKLVFPLLVDKTKGIFEIFQITKKTLALGADFIIIKKLGEEKAAFIDSKKGGKIEILIYDAELARNSFFINILALFASTIVFHDKIGDKIKKALEDLKAGILILKPPKKALELMLNPRRAQKDIGTIEKEEMIVAVKPKVTKEIRKKRQKRKIRGAEEEEELEEKEKDLELSEEFLDEKKLSKKKKIRKKKSEEIEEEIPEDADYDLLDYGF